MEDKKRIYYLRYLLPVYIILLFVMFILPSYSIEEYSILKNTTSHLGAQSTPNSWIMNTVFILLGVACILEGWLHLKNYWFQKIIITIFGSSLILTAFFQHAPIIESIPYNIIEDEIHSFLATLIGFSFTIFAFSVVFIEKKYQKKISALLVGLISTVLSILMFNLIDYAGLWQRLIFIITFGWLIYFFEGMRLNKWIEKKS